MTEVKQTRLTDIRPYARNPRRNDASVDAVANSIKQFGFRAPIIADRDGVIIAGHTRFKAAKKLGLKTVPVIYAEDLTPEQAEAYRIADNAAGSASEWDEDLLQEILAEIGGAYDMADFGLDMDSYIETGDLPDDIVDDEPPAPPKRAKTVPGQIYRLGKHYLLCGDATNPQDMRRLFNAAGIEAADMVLTDPPYNVAIEGETKDHLTIENDDMESGQFIDFMTRALTNIVDSISEGAPIYIWYAFLRTREFWQAIEDAGIKISQNLIWVKSHFVLGHYDYHWAHEPVIYGWKEGAAHYFIHDRGLSTIFEDPPDIDAMTERDAKNLLRAILENTPTDTLHAQKPAASRDHPTMKPVPLLARLIFNSSKPGQTVLDPFGGSGSTMTACEQLNRRCLMMELDPIYCDVIVKRWENLTGEKAEKVST